MNVMKTSTLTVTLSKALIMGGVCALLVGAGNTARAQGYNGHPDRHFEQGANDQNRHFGQGQDRQDRNFGQGRQDVRHDRTVTASERYRLARLHRVYTHDAQSGHYGAAERAHLHAQAIRQDMHATHRDMHQDRRDMHQDRRNQQGDRGY